ncbi:MAG: hypothetical protein MK116_06180 [Phycisphaerales bacterium]|nr:hypothetical protein [Phycisphaerales bacterium]
MAFAGFLIVAVLGTGAGDGSGSWTPAQQAPDGSCWVMLYQSEAPINWYEASALSANANGTLATVPSESMNNFLFSVASSADLPECDGPWLGSQRNATAGLLTDGWTWEDGTPLTYTAWSSDQPNGSPWLTWSLRFDANPTVLPTWASTWSSSQAGQAIYSMLTSFPLPPDCDANGQPDALDIAESPELDGDLDGTIDGCCATDLTGDGDVNVQDILQLLDVWGGPGADLDGDGLTEVDDLLLLIGGYGCESTFSG